MRKIIAICFVLSALPSFALALTAQQEAALTQITPAIQGQMPGELGNVLAQCIVTVASAGELDTLSQGASSALINDIMARSETVSCFAAQ